MTPEERAAVRQLNNERMRARNATEAGKRQKRDCALRTAYGITLIQLEAMIAAQDGLCPICLSKIAAMGKGVGFAAVDHCHETGAVRGILCQQCNAAIGSLGDSVEALERALLYLRKESNWQ